MGRPLPTAPRSRVGKTYNKMNPGREQVAYQATTWTVVREVCLGHCLHTTRTVAQAPATRAFQFADAGAIQPIDDLVPCSRRTGVPRTSSERLSSLKYHGFYVATPGSWTSGCCTTAERLEVGRRRSPRPGPISSARRAAEEAR